VESLAGGFRDVHMQYLKNSKRLKFSTQIITDNSPDIFHIVSNIGRPLEVIKNEEFWAELINPTFI
jgi:hypothetical protein